MITPKWLCVWIVLLFVLAACESESNVNALVSLKNDFNNPAMDKTPLWTICHASFQGVEFEKITLGATSSQKEVKAGMDYILMVLAWDDPDCAPEHCLPVASRNEEEVVPGQERVIALNAPNHQGPCPPEGVAPISEELYNRIVALWPEYGFKSYDQRLDNPQCQ